MSEAAIAADRASLAGAGSVGPAANWHWLMSAAEMAAEVSGVWPFVRAPESLLWQGYPRVATRTPGTGAGAVRFARDFTAATLQRWDVTDRREDIGTVVSELLTNALLHSACPAPALRARPRSASGPAWPRWPVRLGLLQPGPWVMCAVSDPSGEVPERRQPCWYDETGRGLQVVASLCDQWGCTPPGPRGKVVWATFATGPRW